MRAIVLAVLCLGTAAKAADLSAAEIMRRVAANQDHAVELRRQYVYHQHVQVQTRYGSHKLSREETADYTVVPGPEGAKKDLKLLRGRYQHKGRYYDFLGDPRPLSDSIDGDIINDLRNDLINDGGSKDGIGHDLFPLTTAQQAKYVFTLLGTQAVRGRPCFRVGFRPADRHDITWAGEALIDAEEFQPFQVYTKLSRRIPAAVRTLLGTDLPGLGFNVNYERFDKDVWFPVSFGTEFRLRVLFLLQREISVSMQNSGFERATVNSSVRYDTPP